MPDNTSILDDLTIKDPKVTVPLTSFSTISLVLREAIELVNERCEAAKVYEPSDDGHFELAHTSPIDALRLGISLGTATAIGQLGEVLVAIQNNLLTTLPEGYAGALPTTEEGEFEEAIIELSGQIYEREDDEDEEENEDTASEFPFGDNV